MPLLRFCFVGGCWDRTQDRCNLAIGNETLTTRLDLIHTQLGPQCCGSGMLIPDPDFYLSNIPQQHQKRGGGNFFVLPFVATNTIKL
jgi:hypothetical protein